MERGEQHKVELGIITTFTKDDDEKEETYEGPDQKRELRGMMLSEGRSKWDYGYWDVCCSNSGPGTGWRSLSRSGWHIL